jgi:hypothetical protein
MLLRDNGHQTAGKQALHNIGIFGGYKYKKTTVTL